MEQIYTIPVNEAFEHSRDNPSDGCPLCALYRKLEDDELEIILGASFMEPDVRIQTNKKGFCRTHYDQMLLRKNRLGMGLTMESHLEELKKSIKEGGLGNGQGQKTAKRIEEFESSCYICERIRRNFTHMVETVVYLWQKDPEFQEKLKQQPYFCLPHYRQILREAQYALPKRLLSGFVDDCSSVVENYLEKLQKDVSWFCKKFDYRYDEEPWYDSKDAIERGVRFLRSDIHTTPGK